MTRTWGKGLRLPALLLGCLLLLTACRPSAAISKTTYDPFDLNLIQQANMIDREEDSPEEIRNLWNERESEAGESNQEISAGEEGEEDTADQTPEVSYDSEETENRYGPAKVSQTETAEEDRSETAAAQVDDNPDSDSTTAGGAVREDGGSVAGGENQDRGENDAPQLEQDDDNGFVQTPDVDVDPVEKEPEDDGDGGSEDENKDLEIVDPDGDKVTLISGEGKVAAVGEAATLVCMLDGVDRLCATSGSFAGNALAQRAFPLDEEKCEVLWSGDGSSSLSDEDFETLLAIRPDRCFYLSGSGTFTDSQIVRLEAVGSEVICLPSFSSMDGIETAVYQMGVALGDGAEERAEEYLNWCADLKSDLSSLPARNTLFISGWDETAVTTVYGNSGEEVIFEAADGAAVIRVGTNWDRAFLEYAESCARVTDRAKSPYGWMSSITANNPPLMSLCTPDGNLCLISALWAGFYYSASATGSYDMLTGYVNSMGGYRAYPELCHTLLLGLGADSFPAVIVGSASTADKLRASTLWNTATYSTQYSTWKPPEYNLVVPCFTAVDSSFGLNSGIQKISSNILADYGVYVNPAGGVGSWMGGSPESVLEAVWMANVISGYDTASMYETIQDFYSTFYGLNLTRSEIDAYVLAGE